MCNAAGGKITDQPEVGNRIVGSRGASLDPEYREEKKQVGTW
ncbi:MAG TPA: hypothetical protein VKU02_24775 [Gemmataceae bacterium]|nr:hypothetical protein [Gemmataceae bacterium]